MQAILITGATGLIGKHLISELAKRGDDIFILTQNISNSQKKLPGIKKNGSME